MKYVLGSTGQETKRLDIQAKIFEKATLQTLTSAGIKQGMRCLDVGCGSGSTSLVIAELVGKKGKVVGLDINPINIRICRRKAAKVRNAEFIVGNVYDTKFRDSSFDCVFSRFLFQHLTRPEKAIQEMLRLTRRGGIIITEELDHGSWLSYPYDPNLEKLRRTYTKILKLNGSDPFIARKLYKLFLEHGLKPNVEAYSVCVPMNNNSYNMLGVFMAKVLQEKIIQNKMMSRTEFKKMLNGLRCYTARPDGLVLYALTFRIWGKR
jgi:ubiquinone/menaquinone biosynthesis C-methylase UbiE